MTGGASGTSGGVGGMSGGSGGMSGGSGGMSGDDASVIDPDAGPGGDGDCCSGGDCLCREPPPATLEGAAEDGPYTFDSYDNGVGCIYYPTSADAVPPFAAVALSDGAGGSGGCRGAQTGGWGPFYASHGIVAMIVNTTGGDSPTQRGTKLSGGIESFKAENADSTSPLFGKLAGRYSVSGFSMGGGGSTFAASDDPSLLTSVPLMAWTPTGDGVTVPTLFICGEGDTLAVCGRHSEPAFGEMPDTTPKGLVWVSGSHRGQPSAGGGMQGAHGLAFQKVYLEGDERWKPILLSAEFDTGSNLE
jgi:hypothetical protein